VPEQVTIWVADVNLNNAPNLNLSVDDESVRAEQSFTGLEVIQFDVFSDEAQNLYIDGLTQAQAGSKTNPPFAGEFAIAVADVPEPASMSLGAIAALGLLVRPRRVCSIA
jgi:hypothetical protein